MEPVNQGRTKKSEDIIRAELERKSRDLYKVFNPTNQPFEVLLNAKIAPEIWTVPAATDGVPGELIVPKYVHDKYLEEMSQKIITAKSDKAVIAENDKRELKGLNKMDLHTEQYRFESRNLKNLESKREQIVKILDGGLIKEYGLGTDNTQRQQFVDRREQKANFDPGDVLGDKPKAATTPPNPNFSTPSIPVKDLFVCEICGKEVTSKIALLGHQRSHNATNQAIKEAKETPLPTEDKPNVVEEEDD